MWCRGELTRWAEQPRGKSANRAFGWLGIGALLGLLGWVAASDHAANLGDPPANHSRPGYSLACLKPGDDPHLCAGHRPRLEFEASRASLRSTELPLCRDGAAWLTPGQSLPAVRARLQGTPFGEKANLIEVSLEPGVVARLSFERDVVDLLPRLHSVTLTRGRLER